MRISFSPQRRDDALKALKTGDILTINGAAFDLSGIPDGATLPAEATGSEWFAGPIERIEGVLHVTLLLPAGPSPEPWQAFPESITVTEDGTIDVPCDTVITVEHQPAEGGVNVVTTTKRWRQEPEIEVVFVPDPEPEAEPQEAGHDD